MSPNLGKGPWGLSQCLCSLEAPGWAAQPPCSALCPAGYTSLDTDTGDTAVLPESIVMGERQPDHELSTQEEPVVVPVLAPVAWRAVILRRVLAAAAAIAVLLVGILIRLLTGNG